MSIFGVNQGSHLCPSVNESVRLFYLIPGVALLNGKKSPIMPHMPLLTQSRLYKLESKKQSDKYFMTHPIEPTGQKVGGTSSAK